MSATIIAFTGRDRFADFASWGFEVPAPAARPVANDGRHFGRPSDMSADIEAVADQIIFNNGGRGVLRGILGTAGWTVGAVTVAANEFQPATAADRSDEAFALAELADYMLDAVRVAPAVGMGAVVQELHDLATQIRMAAVVVMSADICLA
jgi:hypothetical protein